MTEPNSYAGREQAFIKHHLLRGYFSALIHKIASSYDDIVYIDGYAGPWLSAGDAFEDTSFGIALAEMRGAKEAWKAMGRTIRMRAVLVEKEAAPFAQLQTVSAQFPDIEVSPLCGDFASLARGIADSLAPSTFSFVFIDPTGWKVATKAIEPLLNRRNGEVLLNFMFDFINRAAGMGQPGIVAGLNGLILAPGWRDQLLAVGPDNDLESPARRKAILVEGISETYRRVGGYPYVVETPVFRPGSDRVLYSLIYATRSPKGIEVFRHAQIKTLREQDGRRRAEKLARSGGGEPELFPASDVVRSEIEVFLATEQTKAEAALLALIERADEAPTYGKVWPEILARHAVSLPNLNAIVAGLRRTGRISIPDWTPRSRAPRDEWRIHRPGRLDASGMEDAGSAWLAA